MQKITHIRVALQKWR